MQDLYCYAVSASEVDYSKKRSALFGQVYD